MALAGVLSAMRELILDFDEIPATEGERIKAYRKLFPALEIEEVEDLAKIPGEKWGTYTSSIFNGEREVLRNRFNITLTVLEKNWQAVFGEVFNSYRVIRQLHKARPWKSSVTQALGENFCIFISEELSELVVQAPEIESVARLELLNLSIRRDLDDASGGPRDSIDREQFGRLTVAEVMDLGFTIPSCVKFEIFEFDAVEAYHYFYRHEELLPDTVEEKTVFGAGARNSDNCPRWLEVTEGVFTFLDGLDRSVPERLSSLAEAYLEDCADGITEEDVFVGMLEQVVNLVETGVIVVRNS